MKDMAAMTKEGRKTKQGLRDLNDYGPRRAKDAVAAQPAELVPDRETRAEAEPAATPSVDVHVDGHDDRASIK
jgi:hypothetical protein